jgi:NAD-dependent dihydropyrimidine dehydrogenase PreA subunit
MSLFVAVRVDDDRCRSGQPCTACISVCPVSIFRGDGGLAAVVEANEDECTLCDLCLQRCPTDAIAIRTLYADEVRTGATTKRTPGVRDGA